MTVPELLEVSRSRRQVEIVVSSCLYGCCGTRWTTRDGYEQRYRGVIAHVDVAALRFTLHAIAVASLNYVVVAQLEHLLDVTLLPDANR